MTTPDKPHVIIVDDEPIILEAWAEALGDVFNVQVFADPRTAQKYLTQTPIDVALLDVRMPHIDGLTLLQFLRQVQPHAEAIMVTGHGTIQMAVQAMQLGAYDFLSKPVDDLDAAMRRIASAAEHKRLHENNAHLMARLQAFGPDTQLLGDSAPMQQVRQRIKQIANAAGPVLICGESGTGKELAARALHAHSQRHDKPFIAVNCAALADTLIDSELFGHERGAFTGAVASHKGLFEAADSGVLFLDELGDIPLHTQVRLLRALQENEIRAVGAAVSRRVDVRVIAATHVDLEKSLREGDFREDLYYRVNTFRIDLPPLRERRDDVALLSQHLLAKIGQRTGAAPHTLHADALAAMQQYDWPGNVRELSNAMEHAATLSAGTVIRVADLPALVQTKRAGRTHVGQLSGVTGDTMEYSTARTVMLDSFEQRYLSDLLAMCDGNLSEAARRSGIDRSNLRRLLKRHNLKAIGFKS